MPGLPGIADNGIDTPQIPMGLVDHTGGHLRLGHGSLVGKAAPAQRLDLTAGFFRPLGVFSIGDGNVIAVLGQDQGDALANAAGAAGDDCAFGCFHIGLLFDR